LERQGYWRSCFTFGKAGILEVVLYILVRILEVVFYILVRQRYWRSCYTFWKGTGILEVILYVGKAGILEVVLHLGKTGILEAGHTLHR
jgi:hypothetical protein